ncbi:MAG TPA: S8 family serine peptidase [Candidatus Polarisedimenticolaceae bacterium]
MRPIVVVLSSILLFSSVRAGGPYLRLKSGTFDPLASTSPAAQEEAGGYFVAQFRSAIDPALLSRVRRAGGEPLQYVPDGAYVLRVAPGRQAAVRALADVRWLGPVEPGWKIAPDLGTRPFADPARRAGTLLFATLDLFDGEDAERAAAAVAAAGVEVLQVVRFERYARLKARGSRAALEAAARVPAVSWIEEAAEITMRNNTTRWVIQTDVVASTTVWDRGLHGEGQVVGHIDGRIDMNSCFFRDAANNTPGPTHRKVVAYRSASGLGADSHGTHTAGTSAGDQAPLNGTFDSNGNAYAAKISHSNLSDIDGSGSAPSNLYAYLDAAHADGARVHTNSWGDDGTTAYTSWCVDIDRFAYDREESLVLFAVTNTSTLKTPENAKNVLAVGASANGTSNDNFCSGGRGPTNDGRRKPEIFAPGCSIVSARSSSACSTTSNTGTSMACPAVTAAGALARQYFVDGWYPSGAPNAADGFVPTGALIKATLLNSAVDMTGIANFPSDQEGWGRVLLENALHFDGDLRRLAVLDDVRNTAGLATSGTAEYPLEVGGGAESLKVTLVWTEPPAALLAAAATVNNLDLEVVSPSGTTYLGNVFDPSQGRSIAGGSADPRNNVEQVLLPAAEAGTWTVRVKGAAVNQGLQGYALVAAGDVVPVVTALRYASHAIDDSGSLGNGDGAADPGETVVVPVTLKNTDDAAATGVAGRLSVDPSLAAATRDTATWPTIGAGAQAISNPPHYRVTVDPSATCGTRLTFRIDASSGLGEDAASFGVDVGRLSKGFPATGLPLTVPKKSAAGASSTITVSDAFTLRNVSVSVDVAHADVGELVVTLRSPAGTLVTLHDRSRAGTADLVVTYDRDRAPDGPGSLDDFNGQGSQGTWTLTVVDNVGGGNPAGSIRAFSLDLESSAPISCTPLSCGSPAPGPVPATLGVALENATDLRLSWDAVPGAASYRIWRSPTPDFASQSLAGTSAATTFVDAGAAGSGVDAYYRVRAVNACEWQGP